MLADVVEIKGKGGGYLLDKGKLDSIIGALPRHQVPRASPDEHHVLCSGGSRGIFRSRILVT